ncbi:MAG TPA: Rpn family recombination-promoting nuclease/putative transposase [Spirochaetia bacterium]|nr:Rpn family recombination-promoting nuclease/putative transposase [Spirochaetia bacterium]
MDDARADHDQWFKRLLELFFAEFMQAFFPEAARMIDLQEIHFEPEVVYTDTPLGEKRELDVLVKTRLTGEDGLILVHVEPQAYYQKGFHERMFRYFSHLYYKYRLRILPVAVFSYDQVRDEPDSFELGFQFLDVLRFRFYKLELKKLDWRNYIRSDKAAAAALMSKMGFRKEERIQVKIEFVRMLARMKLDPARSRFLVSFFESYLKLNEQEEKLFAQEVGKLDRKEAAAVMQLTNSWEEKGRAEGKAEIINRFLNAKFGDSSVEMQKEVRRLADLDLLDGVLEKLFAAGSLEEARNIVLGALEK